MAVYATVNCYSSFRGASVASEPGIQRGRAMLFLDSGPGASRRPGMTEKKVAKV